MYSFTTRDGGLHVHGRTLYDCAAQLAHAAPQQPAVKAMGHNDSLVIVGVETGDTGRLLVAMLRGRCVTKVYVETAAGRRRYLIGKARD